MKNVKKPLNNSSNAFNNLLLRKKSDVIAKNRYI